MRRWLHIFDNEEAKKELWLLAKKNTPLLRIAKHYGVERSTIRYWFAQYGFRVYVKRGNPQPRHRRVVIHYSTALPEPQEKNYKEILKDKGLYIKKDHKWGTLCRKIISPVVELHSRSYTTMLYNKELRRVSNTNHIETPL